MAGMSEMLKTLDSCASEAGAIGEAPMAEIAQISPPPTAAHLALNYCRLGASDAQLCEFFAISPVTLGCWLAGDRDFAAAVRRGRKMADAEVGDSLHRLATGYVETVEKVMICRGEPMVVTYRKQHPPHHKATVTWLCNRLPQDWKLPGARRQEVAVAPQTVDLPLLVEEESVVEEQDEAVAVTADEHAEASSDVALPDMDRILAQVRSGVPPPLQPMLVAA
jgi:hypothetical protein